MGLLRISVVVAICSLLSTLAVNGQSKKLVNGTIIITLISNDTIWLGADSRTSTLTEKGYTANKKGMCKIYSTDGTVYAMAGHVRYVDNSFNFLEIMRKCIEEQVGFDSSMILFEKRASSEIRSILKRFSASSINNLIKTNQGAFLSVVAISFMGGEQKMKEMRFAIQAESSRKWKVIFKETDLDSGGNLRFLGHGASASRFVKENKFYFGNGKDVPGKIKWLIEYESDKGSATVGGPAEVISIYNNGFKRIISSGLCN